MTQHKSKAPSKTTSDDRQASKGGPSWIAQFVYAIVLKRFINRKKGAFYDKEMFVDKYGYVKLPGGGVASAASYFLHYGGGEKVQGVTFRPGEPQVVLENGCKMFNSYRPPTVKPTNGSVKPWLALGEHVIPDPAARQHHLRYFAHPIQHPGIKINHALFPTGKIHGTGKDSWFAPIIRLLGSMAGYITVADLKNPFNDYLY